MIDKQNGPADFLIFQKKISILPNQTPFVFL